MAEIAVLDKQTIDKIAAGEVVERPASVVKELTENAIDAGATAITVEIREGGISLVRITDNGCGIGKEQVATAFLRHATSKIRSVNDLIDIGSLGFRGEALSSISAVAQVEMITKTQDELTGTRYVIEGGIEKTLEEVGAPPGTTFLVRNLFFNTPARAKFLKTPTTEGNQITGIVEQMALSHPEVSFKYMQNGQTKLHTSGNGRIPELVYHIYGREIARELLEVSYETEHIKISGYIGKPVVSRGNRNFENYYVNGRYVKSKLIAKGIEDGFGTSMMQHKYPFTLLYLTIDGDEVDVNVHPAKMELRFSDQEGLYRCVYEAVKQALEGKEQIPKVSLSTTQELKEEKKSQEKEKITEKVPEPFETRRRMLEIPAGPIRKETERQEPEKEKKKIPDGYRRPEGSLPIYPENYQRPPVSYVRTEKQMPEEIREENPYPQKESREKPEKNMTGGQQETVEQMELFSDELLTEKARKHHKIIGQVFDTYWLVEYGTELFIIDQHAAHEKVLYEKVMKDFEKKEVTSQLLSPPMIVTLNLQEAELLKKYRELFTKFGFEIEEFGGKEFQIRAVPHNLYGIAKEDLFLELLDHLDETGDKPLEVITAKLATMSCKAAVKGNQQLSVREVDNLIGELLHLEDPYHCPHGRPTIISISKQEMEKKFKRIV